MSQFDLNTTLQLISVVALTGFSTVFMVHAIIRCIKQEAELRKRFRMAPRGMTETNPFHRQIQRTSRTVRNPSGQNRLVSAIGRSPVIVVLALSILVVSAQTTPVRAQNQHIQFDGSSPYATLEQLSLAEPQHLAQFDAEGIQQAALQVEPAAAPSDGNANSTLDLDASFLYTEGANWNSEAAGLSQVRQARIESCYLSAQAFYKVGGQDTNFRKSHKLSGLNRSVTAFYAKQRQRTQFDDCVKQ